jgi:hypothetical protein
MFGRKRGNWIRFDLVDPKAKITTLGTTCISTSAEVAGHLQSVIGSGHIAGINDRVIEKPQISRGTPEPAQA